MSRGALIKSSKLLFRCGCVKVLTLDIVISNTAVNILVYKKMFCCRKEKVTEAREAKAAAATPVVSATSSSSVKYVLACLSGKCGFRSCCAGVLTRPVCVWPCKEVS